MHEPGLLQAFRAQQLARLAPDLPHLGRRLFQTGRPSIGLGAGLTVRHLLAHPRRHPGNAAAEYLRVLEQLHGYFIPYPIDQLHLSNHDHIGLVRALAARDCETAVDVSHQHVDRLHRTMFVGLLEAQRPDDAAGSA